MANVHLENILGAVNIKLLWSVISPHNEVTTMESDEYFQRNRSNSVKYIGSICKPVDHPDDSPYKPFTPKRYQPEEK